jgi:4-hydroxybenzoate polyprenyltransferase
MSAPRATRLGRIADYLQEMFSPLIVVPATLASFCAIWFTLHALAGAPSIRFGWRALAAGVSVTLFSLLLRVYDELKDVETDLRLGRAGDPRYKDRAIVTERVQVGDILALRNAVLVTLVAINAPLGTPWPLIAFVGVLGLMWLSSRWFFAPVISRHLLLAFITHNPLAMTMSAYVIAVFVRDTGYGVPAGAAPLVVGFWMLTAAWETSRKVRRPEDETDYQTYSKVLGWRVAGVVPLAFVAGSVILLHHVAVLAGLSRWLTVAMGAGLAAMAAACLRFELAPSTASARLQPFAELMGGIASLGVPIAVAATLPMQWSFA